MKGRGHASHTHREQGITIHLFVREHKLREGKGAPFRYYGSVTYQRHEGSAPMSVTLKLG